MIIFTEIFFLLNDDNIFIGCTHTRGPLVTWSMRCQKTGFMAYPPIIATLSEKFALLLLFCYLLSSIQKNGLLVHNAFLKCTYIQKMTDYVSEKLCKPETEQVTVQTWNISPPVLGQVNQRVGASSSSPEWKGHIGGMMMHNRKFIFSRLRIHYLSFPVKSFLL